MEPLQLLYLLLALYNLRQCRKKKKEQDERRRENVPLRRLQAGYRRPSRIWSRKWLLRRPVSGNYAQLMHELQEEDPPSFKNYTRVEPEVFAEIVERVTPRLEKQVTPMRIPLAVGLKVACTLRYLATGNSYRDLSYQFRTSVAAIRRFIPVVCAAIIAEFQDEFLKCPSTQEEWQKVADDFLSRWNWPQTGGAVDGKHIAIRKPKNAGRNYFNYKKFHSIILLAVADAKCKFLYVNIGSPGTCSDSTIWDLSSMCARIEAGTIGFPEPITLPGDENENAQKISFHLVADDAFALSTTMMKPFSHRSQLDRERIFSYRLSRARRVIENAFGILAARFRIFLTTIPLQPNTVKTLTLCACILHNLFLERMPPARARNMRDHEDAENNIVPGAWRDETTIANVLLNRGRGGRATTEGKSMREYLSHYFLSEAGRVPWQERAAL